MAHHGIRSSIQPSASRARVTRKKLCRDIVRALNNHKHVTICGPYGIGKTTFARQVLQEMKTPSLVLSLDDGLREMAEQLFTTLFRYRGEAPPQIRTLSGIKRQLRLFKKDSFPIVVDHFFSVSRPKIALLHHLKDHGFRLIVVIESKAREASLAGLHKIIPVHMSVELPRLTQAESRVIIEEECRKRGLHIPEAHIMRWVRRFDGYPLMIVEHFRALSETREETVEPS